MVPLSDCLKTCLEVVWQTSCRRHQSFLPVTLLRRDRLRMSLGAKSLLE